MFFKATSKTHKEVLLFHLHVKVMELARSLSCGMWLCQKMVFNLRILGKKSTPTDLTRRQPDLWRPCDRVPGHPWVELEPAEWEAINATGSVYLHSPWLLYCCARFLANAKRKWKDWINMDKPSFFSKAIKRFAYLRSLRFGNLFLFFGGEEGRSVFGNWCFLIHFWGHLNEVTMITFSRTLASTCVPFSYNCF